MRDDGVPGAGLPEAIVLEETDLAPHRFDQLRGVVADPLLEYHPDVTHIGDARCRIPRDHHEVGVLSHGDRPRTIGAPEKRRAIQRADANRLQRREAALDQQLQLVLVRVARDDAAATGGIRAGSIARAFANSAP